MTTNEILISVCYTLRQSQAQATHSRLLPEHHGDITYYLTLLKILLIVSVASGVRSCSFSDFTMWSVPCLYFWKWAVCM